MQKKWSLAITLLFCALLFTGCSKKISPETQKFIDGFEIQAQRIYLEAENKFEENSSFSWSSKVGHELTDAEYMLNIFKINCACESDLETRLEELDTEAGEPAAQLILSEMGKYATAPRYNDLTSPYMFMLENTYKKVTFESMLLVILNQLNEVKALQSDLMAQQSEIEEFYGAEKFNQMQSQLTLIGGRILLLTVDSLEEMTSNNELFQGIVQGITTFAGAPSRCELITRNASVLMQMCMKRARETFEKAGTVNAALLMNNEALLKNFVEQVDRFYTILPSDVWEQFINYYNEMRTVYHESLDSSNSLDQRLTLVNESSRKAKLITEDLKRLRNRQ